MIKAKALTLCLAMLANASVRVSAQAMTVSAQLRLPINSVKVL